MSAISCLCLLIATTAPAADCTTKEYDSQAQIRHIIDGDTVILQDKTHVRLIGIDTPELGRRGKADQIGAQAAKQFLNRLLPKHSWVNLKYDKQRQDRHQRTLAHLFIGNDNVQQRLLEQGLATTLAMPPNLAFTACYEHNSQTARRQQTGLWSEPQYQTITAEQLQESTRGYRIVSGRISRIGESPSSLWLNMGQRLALRIAKTDLPLFNGLNINALLAKTVQVRGKVYKHKQQLRMRLRHPVNLDIQ